MRSTGKSIAIAGTVCAVAMMLSVRPRQIQRPVTPGRVLVDRAVRLIARGKTFSLWPKGAYHFQTRIFLPYPGSLTTDVLTDRACILRTDHRGNASWTVFISDGRGWSNFRGVVSQLDRRAWEQQAFRITPANLRALLSPAGPPETLGWKHLADGSLVESVRVYDRYSDEVILDFDPATGLPIAQEFGSPYLHDWLIRFVSWRRVGAGLLPARTEYYRRGALTAAVVLQSYTPAADTTLFREPETWTPRTELSLKFCQDSGLPIVNLRVNGKPLRMLVDTGSGVTSLSAQAAQKLHLPLGDEDERPISFRKARYRLSQVRRLELGGIRFDSFPLIVTETSPIDTDVGAKVDGLLGNDVLAHFQLTLDYPRRLLLLRPRSAITPVGTGEPLRLEGGAVLVEAQTLGTRFSLHLDTGCNGAALTPATLQRISTRCGRTLASIPGMAVLPELKVAGQRVTNFEVRAPSQGETDRASLEDTVGNTFLQSCRVTIDYARQILILQPANKAGPNATPSRASAS